MEPNLSQALHLLNGQTLQSKISAGGLIDNWLKEMKKPEEIIDELYIRCFTRMPTSEEKGKLVEVVNAATDKKQILEDVFWALLNSREFLFNS